VTLKVSATYAHKIQVLETSAHGARIPLCPVSTTVLAFPYARVIYKAKRAPNVSATHHSLCILTFGVFRDSRIVPVGVFDLIGRDIVQLGHALT
jgi:hypothetical protein